MSGNPSQETDDRQPLGPDLSGRLQDRFGLAGDPFSDNRGFFFPGARRGHALNSLRHLAAFGDRALWLFGAEGAGKSRLVSEFCRLEQGNLDIRHLGGAQLESREALSAALSKLSQQRPEPALSGQALIDAFFRWSESLPARGRRMVLLIGATSPVSDECLESLVTGFGQAKRSHAAIPLIVRESSAQSLLQGEAKEHVRGHVHQIELPPLERRDIAGFLEQAFQYAGADSMDRLDDATLEKLEAVSGGNIGLLQQKAPAILLGLVPSRKTRTGPVSRRPWGWLLLVLLLLAGSFVLMSREYQHASRTSSQTAGHPAEKSREMIHLALNMNGKGPKAGEDDPYPEGASTSQPRPAPSSLPVYPASKTTAAGKGATPLASTDTSQPPHSASSFQAMARSPHAEGRQAKKEEFGGLRPAEGAMPQARASAAPPDREMATHSATSRSLSGLTEARVKAGEIPARTSMPAMAPSVSAKRAVSQHESPKNVVKSKGQEPGGFTASLPGKYTERAKLDRSSGFIVQLSGSYDERYAVRTLQRFSALDLHYTRTQYRGKPWFVVFMGPYPGLGQARAAVESLPHELHAGGPWIRRAKGL